MDVSVIIAAGRPDMARCLQSMREQAGEIEYEIIVVGERGMARPGDGVVWIEADTSNPATKRNMGAASASGRYLAFIDDDAWAPSDWLAKIVRLLDEDPKYAGIGGPNLIPEDATEPERLTDAVLSSKLGSGTGSYTSGGESREAKVGEIHLVNFAVRRDFFLEMGGFNEALGYGAEDSEFIYLANRLQLARFDYRPELQVWHRRRPFGAELLGQRYRLRRQNGRLVWVRPGMYAGNAMFLAAILGGAAIVPLAIILPWLPAALAILYVCTLLYTSVRAGHNNKLKWMLAVASVHFVSVAGIFAGLLRIPGSREYKGLLRRPS